MLGAIIKSYYAENNGIDPESIYTVSVMPCTAKKFEAKRDELGHDGLADVDAVLTVRELARMIKTAGIDFARLPDEEFDDMLGDFHRRSCHIRRDRRRYGSGAEDRLRGRYRKNA